MRLSFLNFCIALVLTCLCSTAFAQVTVEGFEPRPTQEADILNVSTATVSPHLLPTVGLFTHFVDDALIYRQADALDSGAVRALDNQLKTELAFALGLFNWIDIGFVLPITVFQEGDARTAFGLDAVDSFAMADPRLSLKTKLLPERIAGFGAALLLTGYAPLGDEQDYHSDGVFRVEPKLAIDYDGPVKIALNVGYQFRPETTFENVGSDDYVRMGGGFALPMLDSLDLIATVSGGIALADGVDPTDPTKAVANEYARPFEWNGGARLHLPADLMLTLGGGSGITKGIGSPDFRLFAGISHRVFSQVTRREDQIQRGVIEANPDPDGDGITGIEDLCPEQAEDPDGFEDEDGCPDPDNDEDNILDYEDQCPNVAGIATKQGCPFVDEDGDKIDDTIDACPDKPEDVDGFEDDDGCPEADNDRDGILDADDKCPEEKEIINGVEDDDGCPDTGDTKVVVTDDQIQILDTVYFDTGKATIQTRSFDLLNQVASVLRANPQILRVRVEGHTDSRGKAEKNMKLSNDRADSVRTFLMEAGIDLARLESVGYGELRPVADNINREGRALNRRVEFLILDVRE